MRCPSTRSILQNEDQRIQAKTNDERVRRFGDILAPLLRETKLNMRFQEQNEDWTVITLLMRRTWFKKRISKVFIKRSSAYYYQCGDFVQCATRLGEYRPTFIQKLVTCGCNLDSCYTS